MLGSPSPQPSRASGRGSPKIQALRSRARNAIGTGALTGRRSRGARRTPTDTTRGLADGSEGTLIDLGAIDVVTRRREQSQVCEEAALEV